MQNLFGEDVLPRHEFTAEQIYKVYPRCGDRKTALRRIEQAIKKESANHKNPSRHLYERVKVYAEFVRDWPPHEHKFIPLCSTWFNKERYNDDYTKPLTGLETFRRQQRDRR